MVRTLTRRRGSRRNTRRGLSYILSVLVMTVVTVSLSSVVLFWALRTVDETQTGFTLDVQSRMDKARERMVVESVEFIDANTLRVYVRNVGNVQIIIDQIYIDNQQGAITTPGSGRLGLSIQSAGSVTVDVTALPFTLDAGQSYLITVASTRGNTDRAFWSA